MENPSSLLCSSSSGASFTRFQTLRLQKIFPESLANQLISYGSCQFPTLGFVVERFKAIQAFIPETFYKIKGTNSSVHGHADPMEMQKKVLNWLSLLFILPVPLCLSLSQCCMRWRRTPWSSAGKETVCSTTQLAWCSTRSAWRYEISLDHLMYEFQKAL